MKSRMQENCTSGSVRGSRQAFHFKYDERSVETVYSTEEMTAKEILKQLKADGWTEKSQRGSHLQLVPPTKPGKVTVPMHTGKDLDPKTANSILKQAGLK